MCLPVMSTTYYFILVHIERDHNLLEYDHHARNTLVHTEHPHNLLLHNDCANTFLTNILECTTINEKFHAHQ